jgi:hypothetical protein
MIPAEVCEQDYSGISIHRAINITVCNYFI